MRFNQVVYECPNLVKAEFGGGVGVEHGGVVDVFTLATEGGFYGEGLDIDVGLHHCGKVGGQGADFGRLDAAFVHQARDFNTAALREVVNQAAVGDVAIDDAGLAGFERVDDEGTVFMAAFVSDFEFAPLEGGFSIFPLCDLMFTALDILVQWNPVLLDQVEAVAFDEPGGVFAEVFTGFGDEVPRPAEDVVADVVGDVTVAVLVGPGFGDLTEAGVQVFAIPLKFQVKRHVVDARADVVDFVVGDVHVFGEHFCGALDAVAQANGLDVAGACRARGAGDGPAVHRHRVDVLEKGHVRADFFHVVADVEEDGDGAKGAHDATDAERVGDGLAEAVFFGNLEVNDRAGFVAPDLEHADGVVRSVEGAAAVEGGLDFGLRAEKFSDFVGDDLRSAEAFGVNVHQADGRVGEFREREDVAEEIFGEDGAACAEEGDFGHGGSPVVKCQVSG